MLSDVFPSIISVNLNDYVLEPLKSEIKLGKL